MKDQINVVIRVRPLNDRELSSIDQDGNRHNTWAVNGNSISQKINTENRSGTGLVYTFDQIYDMNVKTEDIYDGAVKDIIDSTMNGINGTVFAYGQTSSGKTYTMYGDTKIPGLISIAVKKVFEHIRDNKNRQFLVRVSYLEIYNEIISDLLDPSKKNLKIGENLEKDVFVKDSTEQIVLGPQEVFSLLSKGEGNRHIGCTNMNERSSRAHTIFRMVIESGDTIADQDKYNKRLSESINDGNVFAGSVKISTLSFVDLAGSERVGHTGAEGARLREGAHINKSLLALGTVIGRLSENGVNSRAKTITNMPEVNEELRGEALLRRLKKVQLLEKEVAEMQRMVSLKDDKTEENKKLEAELKSYETLIFDLKNQNSNLKIEIDNISNSSRPIVDTRNFNMQTENYELESHMNEINILKKQINTLAGDNSKNSSIIAGLVNDKATLINEKTNLIVGISELESKYKFIEKSFTEKMENLTQELTTSKCKINENNLRYEKEKVDLSTNLNETRNLLNNERMKSTEIELKYKDELNLKDKTINQLESNNKIAEIKLISLSESLKSQTLSFENERSSLVEQIIELKSKLEEKNEEIDKIKNHSKYEIDSIKSTMKNSEAKFLERVSLLEEKNTYLENEIKERENDINEIQSKFSSSQNNLAETSLEIIDLKKEFEAERIKLLEGLYLKKLDYDDLAKKNKQVVEEFEKQSQDYRLKNEKLQVDLENNSKEFETIKLNLESNVSISEKKLIESEAKIFGHLEKSKSLSLEIEKLKSDFEEEKSRMTSEYDLKVENLCKKNDDLTRLINEKAQKIDYLSQNLTETNKNYEEVIKSKDNEISVLKNNMLQQTNLINSLESNFSQSNNKIEMLTNDLKLQKIKFEQDTSNIKENFNKERSEIYTKLEEEKLKLLEKDSKIQSLILELQKSQDLLDKEIDNKRLLEIDRKNITSNSEELKSKISQSEFNLKVSVNKIDQLSSELEKKISEFSAEKHDLLNKLEASNSEFSIAKLHLENMLDEKNKDVSSLKDALNSLQSNFDKNEQEFSEKESKLLISIQDLARSNSDLESSLKSSSDEIVSLNHQIETIEAQKKSETSSIIDDFESQLSRKEKDIDNIYSELEIAKKDCKIYLEELKSEKNSYNSASIEIENLKFEVLTLESDINKYKQLEESLLQEIDLNKGMASKEIESGKTQIDNLKKSIKEIESKKLQEFNELTSEISILKESLSDTKFEIVKLHDKLKEKNDTIEDLRTKEKELIAQHNLNTESINSTNTEYMNQLENKISLLTKNISDLNSDLSNSKQACIDLDEKYKLDTYSLKAEINQQKEDIDTKEKSILNLETCLSDLKQSTIETNIENEKIIKNLTMQKDSFELKLKESNLKVDLLEDEANTKEKDFNIKISDFELHMSEKNEEINRLHSKIHSLEKDLDTKVIESDTLVNSIKESNDSLVSELKINIERMNESNRSKSCLIEDNLLNIKNLTSELREKETLLKNTICELEDLRKHQLAAQDKICDLEERQKLILIEKNESQTILSKRDEVLADLQVKIQTLEENLHKSNEDFNESDNQKQKAIQVLEQTNKEKLLLTEMLEKTKCTMVELTEVKNLEIEKLQKELNSLNESVIPSMISVHSTKILELNELIETITSELKIKNDNVFELEESVSKLNQSCNEQRDEILKLTTKAEDILGKSQTEITSLEKDHESKISELELKVAEKTQLVSEVEKNIAELSNEYENYQKKYDVDLNNVKSSFLENENNLNQIIADLNQKLSESEKKIIDLTEIEKKMRENLDSQKEMISEMNEKIKVYINSEIKINETISNQEKEIENFIKARNELYQTIDKLESKIVKLESSIEENSKVENELNKIIIEHQIKLTEFESKAEESFKNEKKLNLEVLDNLKTIEDYLSTIEKKNEEIRAAQSKLDEINSLLEEKGHEVLRLNELYKICQLEIGSKDDLINSLMKENDFKNSISKNFSFLFFEIFNQAQHSLKNFAQQSSIEIRLSTTDNSELKKLFSSASSIFDKAIILENGSTLKNLTSESDKKSFFNSISVIKEKSINLVDDLLLVLESAISKIVTAESEICDNKSKLESFEKNSALMHSEISNLKEASKKGKLLETELQKSIQFSQKELLRVKESYEELKSEKESEKLMHKSEMERKKNSYDKMVNVIRKSSESQNIYLKSVVDSLNLKIANSMIESQELTFENNSLKVKISQLEDHSNIFAINVSSKSEMDDKSTNNREIISYKLQIESLNLQISELSNELKKQIHLNSAEASKLQKIKAELVEAISERDMLSNSVHFEHSRKSDDINKKDEPLKSVKENQYNYSYIPSNNTNLTKNQAKKSLEDDSEEYEFNKRAKIAKDSRNESLKKSSKKIPISSSKKISEGSLPSKRRIRGIIDNNENDIKAEISNIDTVNPLKSALKKTKFPSEKLDEKINEQSDEKSLDNSGSSQNNSQSVRRKRGTGGDDFKPECSQQ
ncbi:Kinesin-related protein 4 [Smittium culicis]|uniref:Kinesin-related protein 4 n=1 Tax=Smittium culicis TaxID=133412 RepID=A0A1R1X0Z1_9FUNG|nr:Kinesin-related protein 4 [Smittium culicis]